MSAAEQPWDFSVAHARCAAASRRQEAAEEALRATARDYAEAEERYRLALAKAIITAHDDGIAWTVCPDIARGQPEVARLRKARDIAEGVREAMTQAAWRRAADRKDAQRFADWSQRREMAEASGQVAGPLEPETFGGRRAA